MNKIAFIGAGAMAEAMFSGLVAQKVIKAKNIYVTNRSNVARLSYLKEEYGVSTTTSTEEAMKNADVVVIAVKPKDIITTMDAIQKDITTDMLLISVAAGVSIESFEAMIGKDVAVVRSMPNTSATVGKSATGICTNQHVTEQQKQTAITLFETIGSVVVVKENQLDAVTGISGSGPAYFYFLVEAMEQAAANLGLETDTAKQLIIQTMEGAAEMLKTSPKSPATLRQEVTSPGGTTEAGLNVLQTRHVPEAIVECIETATKQSKQMGKQISEKIAEHVTI